MAILGLLVTLAVSAHAEGPTHERLAREYLGWVRAREALDAATEDMFQRSLATDPSMAPLAPWLRLFFERYGGWAAIEPQVVEATMAALTPQELRALNTFYRSPVGQRALDAQGTIHTAITSASQAGLAAHQAELEALLQGVARPAATP